MLAPHNLNFQQQLLNIIKDKEKESLGDQIKVNNNKVVR